MKQKGLITKMMLLLLCSICTLPVLAAEKQIAFPGAEGFGRYATGGRGGTVYHVTNLNDSGTGSLRWALNQSGKKIIVFDVSGTIHLQSALHIGSNTTIAGQSAHGDGICIADYPCDIKGNNVIVRYMRFRLGSKNAANSSDSWDGFGSLDQSNIIIDHCSVSWSFDECLSMSGCSNITVQWCISSQSMTNVGHSKGNHGYGGNWGGSGATYHHNLIAHHGSRTPRLGPRPTTQLDERMDMRNNVIYNFGGNGCYGGEAMTVNIVNNYYKPGAATKSGKYQYRIAGLGIRTTKYVTDNPAYKPAEHIWGKYYVTGNYNTKMPTLINDDQQWEKGIYEQISASDNDGLYNDEVKEAIRLSSPMTFVGVTTHTAEKAYEKVLQYVGASLHRDSYDASIISDVTNGTATVYAKELDNSGNETGNWLSGGIINSENDLKPAGAGDDWSAWPTLNSTAAPTDTDGDGMPDDWEESNGLDANDASDGNGTNLAGDGYTTNVEHYLNSLVADITNAQSAEGTFFGIQADGSEVVINTLSDQTYTGTESGAWNFGDGFNITTTSGSYNNGYGSYVNNTFRINRNQQYTINLPEKVSIKSITFSGYCYNTSATSRLSEVNGTSYTSGYTFNKKASSGTQTLSVNTIEFAQPVKDKITFTTACTASSNNYTCMTITLNGSKEGEQDITPDEPTTTSAYIIYSDDLIERNTLITKVDGVTLTYPNLEFDSPSKKGNDADKDFTHYVCATKTQTDGANANGSFSAGKSVTNALTFTVEKTGTITAGIQLNADKGLYIADANYNEVTPSSYQLPADDTKYAQTLTDNKLATKSQGTISWNVTPGTYYLVGTGTRMGFYGFKFVENTTGIETIKSSEQRLGDDAIYNLQGVRVQNPTQRGIYIRNGKKFVVK